MDKERQDKRKIQTHKRGIMEKMKKQKKDGKTCKGDCEVT